MAKSGTCKWFSIKESTPKNNQEVLIKCDDGFHVAIYDEDKSAFRLRGNALLSEQECELHWMPIIFPEK